MADLTLLIVVSAAVIALFYVLATRRPVAQDVDVAASPDAPVAPATAQASVAPAAAQASVAPGAVRVSVAPGAVRVSVAPGAAPSRAPVLEIPAAPAGRVITAPAALPKIDYDEDGDVEATKLQGQQRKRASVAPPTQKIIYDDDAATDEPTHSGALILVTASAQTDKGRRRKRNEDSVLAREEDGIFVVADGMGGYRGGEIASKLAVATIDRAFATKTFDGPEDDGIPRRASELARAIQMANEAILEHAEGDKNLEGMGTTVCAARFSRNKQRLYVGHVGDSRIYCYRRGVLRQMTTDHTMKDLGVVGETAAHLSRAVGVWPVVPIDIVLGKPQPGDLYLLCSDGLTKMVNDEDIGRLLGSGDSPAEIVEALVKAANEHGGKDNVSVILVRVDDATTRPHAAA